MFSRVDRVQLAVPDRGAAAEGWVRLLGAEHTGDDRVGVLAARRSRYRLGAGWVELLEPDGEGPVAQALRNRDGRGHLYAGGLAVPDPERFAGQLRSRGVEPPAEHHQLFLDTEHTGGHGLRLVVSADDGAHPAVGAVDQLYEVTNLVRDHAAVVEEYVERFALDDKAFCPITSDEYGYEGTLTLLADDRLDRLEVITPTAPETTMGRFFAKHGETLYMAFAETGDLPTIEERAQAAGAPHTRVPPADQRPGLPPDTVFLHPGALGGMMLGLSRRTVAWVWSGHPERVERLAE